MSGMYYRVDPVPPPPVSFGFRKVEEAELQQIVQRLTKPTYNSTLQKDLEQRFVHNYSFLRQNNSRRRTPSACAKRRSATAIPSTTSNRQISERDIQRIFRRVQTHTQASIYRTVYTGEPKQKDPFSKECRPQQLRDQLERTKAFERLRRPTTASRAKNVQDCHTCSENQLRSKFDLDVPLDYEYADDAYVKPEELDFIVERIRATTLASEDSKRCERLPPFLDEVKIREKIPLVSGLARSKNINEIVERLHPNPRRHGYKPEATPITVK